MKRPVVWLPRFRRFGNWPILSRYRVAVPVRRLEAGPEGVFLNGTTIVRRDALRSVVLVQNAEGHWFVNLESRGSGFVSVEVRDPEQGEKLLRALEADARSLTARFVVIESGRLVMMALGVAIATGLMVVGMILARTIDQAIHPSVLPIVGLVPLVMLFFLTVRLTVGVDGIVIRQGFSTRFIAHDQIETLVRENTDVVLRTRDGRQFRFPMALDRRAVGEKRDRAIAGADALVARVEQARAAALELGGEAPNSAALARTGETTREWLASLRKIGSGVDAFRGNALGRDRLWALVESTRLAPSIRVSAAVALSASGDPETTRRLHRIAEGCASPELGTRIRVAADAEDDRALEKLLDDVDDQAAKTGALRRAD